MEAKRGPSDERRLPDLPSDVIADILSRLPLKCLCRFRCVSKPWRSLISNPHFTKVHFDRNRNTITQKLILFSDHSLHSLETPPDDGGDAIAVKLEFPNLQNPNQWTKMCGSCDGLILVSGVDDSLFLANPSTRSSKLLPKSSFYMRKLPKTYRTVGNVYGFGFDSSKDDYKVVRIFYYGEFQQFPRNIVSVYSLGTNSWKRVMSSPFDHSDGVPSPGVFVNGSLHWLAVPPGGLFSDVTIASFNLSTEMFNDVPMPSFVHIHDVDDLQCCKLGALGGRLCLFNSRFLESFLDVCIMIEYGRKETWVQLEISTGHYHYMEPVRFSEESLLTLQQDRQKLFLCGIGVDTYAEVVIRDKPSEFEARSYVESLISPCPDIQI